MPYSSAAVIRFVYCFADDVFVLFRTLSFVVERRGAGENVRRDEGSDAGRRHAGDRRNAGTSRLHESRDQRIVSHEPDIGRDRPDSGRGVRILGLPCAGQREWLLVDSVASRKNRTVACRLQTMVVTQNQIACRLPEYFRRPDEFRPERWLKDGAEHEAVNPYLVLPFGHGPRTCVARRLAEQFLQIVLIKVRTSRPVGPSVADGKSNSAPITTRVADSEKRRNEMDWTRRVGL